MAVTSTLFSPSYSPEYGSAEDCNFNLALLNWGCRTLLDITNRLHLDDELIPRWKSVLQDLTPYPVEPNNGLMIGRDVPYVHSHRHYSHLLAAYPLYLINRENSEEYKLIEQSLDYWQSESQAHRGYSYTGGSSLSAALGKGNDALVYLTSRYCDRARWTNVPRPVTTTSEVCQKTVILVGV